MQTAQQDNFARDANVLVALLEQMLIAAEMTTVQAQKLVMTILVSALLTGSAAQMVIAQPHLSVDQVTLVCALLA